MHCQSSRLHPDQKWSKSNEKGLFFVLWFVLNIPLNFLINLIIKTVLYLIFPKTMIWKGEEGKIIYRHLTIFPGKNKPSTNFPSTRFPVVWKYRHFLFANIPVLEEFHGETYVNLNINCTQELRLTQLQIRNQTTS